MSGQSVFKLARSCAKLLPSDWPLWSSGRLIRPDLRKLSLRASCICWTPQLQFDTSFINALTPFSTYAAAPSRSPSIMSLTRAEVEADANGK